ncbi:MAG TPA: RDD family protein [Flavobacterium sp.]|nr:RDD family protein [Flavobacterium sp.]
MTEQTTELTFLKSSRKRRIAAFMIDHLVMTFLMVSIVFIVLGPNFMDENNPSKMMTTMLFVMIPGFILYFAKDSLKGISVGKWIMGIMVRDENDQNEIPSFGRLFLRNLFIIIWPIEFIVLATNEQKKRLGDKVAKTVVVKNPNKSVKNHRIFALIGVGIAFFVFVFFTVGNAMKNSDAYKVATKEIEQNKDLINETGGIKGYGIFPNGNIRKSTNGQGQAQLEIKVLGNTKDITVSVYLEKEPNGQWKLIEMQK